MAFNLGQKCFFGILLLVALFCSFFHLHGFSLPIWHEWIDHSKASEILIGQGRDIRPDDWALDIPLMLSQSVQEPSFPLWNSKIGTGSSMLVPFALPVKNVSVFFKPGAWGFFVSDDFGVSWLWWSKYLGLLASIYLVLWCLTQHSLWSFLGALIFLYSPYTQFWTLHNYECVIHAAFAFSFLLFILYSHQKKTVFLSALLLGWSAVGFVIDNIYPPYQIVVGLFFLCLTISYCIENGLKTFSTEHKSFRLFSLSVSIALIALGGILFAREAWDAILLIQNTAYPGKRMTLGGGFPKTMLFPHNLFISWGGILTDWRQLVNYCEGANFIYFFPVILFQMIFQSKAKRNKPWILYTCFGFLSFLFLYTYVGLPEWLAILTLMAKSNTNRTQIGMGLAEICILILFLKQRTETLTSSQRKKVLIATALFIFGFAYFFVSHVDVNNPFKLFLAAAFYLGLSSLTLSPKLATRFLIAFAIVSFLYTFPFNPVVKGGTEFLRKNALAEKILAIDKQFQGKSKWVLFGESAQAWVLSNYFRILGVHSLVGYFPQPQLKIFKPFDPTGMQASVYNQCAFVRFVATDSQTATFPFEPGQIRVKVSPEANAFRELGVTHFLFVQETPSTLSTSSHLKKVDSFQDHTIYELY